MTGAIAMQKPANDMTAPPITAQDLIDYMQSGCKDAAQWRIGTEHEKFLYHKEDYAPVDYDRPDGRNIKTLLETLSDRYSWTLVYEGEMITGVTKGKYSINLETGGQLELSGAPLPDMHLTMRELHTYLDEVRKICNELGIGLMGIGLRPKETGDDVPFIHRPRYDAILADAAAASQRQWGQMTAAVQTNMDYGSESDMIRKMRVALALQPIATAIFANSPFLGGRPSGHLCQRYHYSDQASREPQRRVLDCIFDPRFDFRHYVNFIMQEPMKMIIDNGQYHKIQRGNFGNLMAGKLPGYDGRRADRTDLLAHISTIYTDVRLRNYIEMRGSDAGQWRMLIGLPALWTGLLYDSSALDQAYHMIKKWSVDDMMKLRMRISQRGLHTPFRLWKNVRGIAMDMLQIAYGGLRARPKKNDYGEDETIYLDRLMYFVATGKTPAEYLLENYHQRWSQNIHRVMDECSF